MAGACTWFIIWGARFSEQNFFCGFRNKTFPKTELLKGVKKSKQNFMSSHNCNEIWNKILLKTEQNFRLGMIDLVSVLLEFYKGGGMKSIPPAVFLVPNERVIFSLYFYFCCHLYIYLHICLSLRQFLLFLSVQLLRWSTKQKTFT